MSLFADNKECTLKKLNDTFELVHDALVEMEEVRVCLFSFFLEEVG